MATKLVISGATVNCVYDDRFRPLFEALGVISVKRASEVEFDETSGEWVATHLDSGEVIARGLNRNDVIKAEIAWLEERLCPTR